MPRSSERVPNVETKLIHCGLLAIELALDLMPDRELYGHLDMIIRNIVSRYYIPTFRFELVRGTGHRYLYEAMNVIISVNNDIVDNRLLDRASLNSRWRTILTNTFNYINRDDISLQDWMDYVEIECQRRIPFAGLGPHDIEYKTQHIEPRGVDDGLLDFVNGFFAGSNFSDNCHNEMMDLCIRFFDEYRDLLTSSGMSLYQLGKYFFGIISDSIDTRTKFFSGPFGRAFLDAASDYGSYSFIENEDGELDCINS